MNEKVYSTTVGSYDIIFNFNVGILYYVEIRVGHRLHKTLRRDNNLEDYFWKEISYYLKLLLELETIQFKKLYEFSEDNTLKYHCKKVLESNYENINSELSREIDKLKSKQNLFSDLKREYLG